MVPGKRFWMRSGFRQDAPVLVLLELSVVVDLVPVHGRVVNDVRRPMVRLGSCVHLSKGTPYARPELIELWCGANDATFKSEPPVGAAVSAAPTSAPSEPAPVVHASVPVASFSSVAPKQYDVVAVDAYLYACAASGSVGIVDMYVEEMCVELIVAAAAAAGYEFGLVASNTSSSATCIALRSCRRRASRPFLRAVFIDASTTDERIPMMAMTTSNSIKVKPFCLLI
jgi:hypothetical protein